MALLDYYETFLLDSFRDSRMTERLTLNSLQRTGSAGRGVPAGRLPETICSIIEDTTSCPRRTGRANSAERISAGLAASSPLERPPRAGRVSVGAIGLNPVDLGDRAIEKDRLAPFERPPGVLTGGVRQRSLR